jgi:hypothetical protein
MLFAALAVAALGGCTPQRMTAEKEAAACKAQFPQWDTPAQVVGAARCLNDVAERYAPNNPLTPLVVAARAELAEKVHNGQMTFAEAQAELTRTIFEASQELTRTNAGEDAGSPAVMTCSGNTCVSY